MSLKAFGLLLLVGLAGCAEPGSPGSGHPGKTTYQRYCFSCHASGVAGAPRSGDVEAWASRAVKGKAALLRTTIAGIPPGMPPKGLCAACTDEQLEAAIDYMIDAATR